MRAVITVAITVTVPDGTHLVGLYLDLPTDQSDVLSLQHDKPIDATVQAYETLQVRGEQE